MLLRVGKPKPKSSRDATSRRRQTFAELRELQRVALLAIRNPLTPAGDMQRRWKDGRPTRQVIAEFIKPNDRLTSIERLEIYNRQYWYRLLDCLWDDFPGLRAILGLRKFEKLRIAYLDRYPSKSFSLRNLGGRLVQFLEEGPHWTAPHQTMCLDMARFEWAQVIAFDSEAKPPIKVDDLLGRDPSKLRLALQPHITLLELDYPLDDFVIALKQRDASMRSEASNAVESDRKSSRVRAVKLPRRSPICLAVHRYNNSLYYKRLEPAQFALLSALRDGQTLDRALEKAVPADAGDEWAEWIRKWFAEWTQLGWFCKRETGRGK
jgi:hypothetical protein